MVIESAVGLTRGEGRRVVVKLIRQARRDRAECEYSKDFYNGYQRGLRIAIAILNPKNPNGERE